MIEIWESRVGQKLSPREIKSLQELALESQSQLQILLRDYLDVTAYPNFKDFHEYAKNRIMMDDIPDPLSCQAYLTKNPLLEKLGNDLEALLGAWHPDEITKLQVQQLREKLKAALE